MMKYTIKKLAETDCIMCMTSRHTPAPICMFAATYLINEKALCKAHAGVKALEILLEKVK